MISGKSCDLELYDGTVTGCPYELNTGGGRCLKTHWDEEIRRLVFHHFGTELLVVDGGELLSYYDNANRIRVHALGLSSKITYVLPGQIEDNLKFGGHYCVPSGTNKFNEVACDVYVQDSLRYVGSIEEKHRLDIVHWDLFETSLPASTEFGLCMSGFFLVHKSRFEPTQLGVLIDGLVLEFAKCGIDTARRPLLELWDQYDIQPKEHFEEPPTHVLHHFLTVFKSCAISVDAHSMRNLLEKYYLVKRVKWAFNSP